MTLLEAILFWLNYIIQGRSSMISIFLSYPKPHTQKQNAFITTVHDKLLERGLTPRTLGTTDYDLKAPLAGIRRLMFECNGILTIAFRRTYIEEGEVCYKSDIDSKKQKKICKSWFTSPYCQIEPAMAFQLGIPILIWREHGVIADGVLEHGVLGHYMPEFDLDKQTSIINTDEWLQLFSQWEMEVRRLYTMKGQPRFAPNF